MIVPASGRATISHIGVCAMVILRKKLRKLVTMAKNRTKRGRSVRNGNAASPYKKYEKRPHRYSQDYRDWFNKMRYGGAARPKAKVKHNRVNTYFKEAAE